MGPGARRGKVLRDVALATGGLAVTLGAGLALGLVPPAVDQSGAARGSGFLFVCSRFLHSAHQALGHHAAHILLIGGAALVYAGYLAVHVARNGLPAFSWRLRPNAPNA